MTELSPTDRVSLYHGKLIMRYERVLKQIARFATEQLFVNPRRGIDLSWKIRKLARRECERMLAAAKPRKEKR